MLSMLGTILVYIIILALIFGGLCSITGEKSKGQTIVLNCITAIILYMFVLQLFNTEVSNASVLNTGIPLINNVERFGSVKKYIMKSPGQFALDFVELVVVTLIVNWLSNLFSFDNSGFTGKIISRIIIVLSSIIVYGILMDLIQKNILLTWCVYSVECIITGGSILYTPIMIISSITGLRYDNHVIMYLVEKFPNTSIGKAISTAITSSIIFLVILLVLESQYGSVCNILQGTLGAIESMGSVVIIMIGLYILMKCLKDTH